MQTLAYPVLIEEAAPADFVATFPDIPEAITGGRSAEQAPVPVMVQAIVLEFQHKFDAILHQVQREPVKITHHGRRESVLTSAEHYDWLTATARRTHRTTDADTVVIDAVQRAQMSPEHAALDELLT